MEPDIEVRSSVARRPLWWRLAREALVLGGLWILYSLGRGLSGRYVGSAYDHATDVWWVERRLWLPDEAAVQAWALERSWLIRAANDWYRWEHWVALAAVTFWLLAFRPEHYPWFRRLLVLTTGLALVGHFAYPLMPPRMRPDLGIVDSGIRFGQSVYGPNYANHGLVNQYAAMPSMHVGWAALFALTVIVVARTPWRWLALGYPWVTTWVVVATGNHYWLDGAVGVLLLGIAIVAVHGYGGWPGSVPARPGDPAVPAPAGSPTAGPG